MLDLEMLHHFEDEHEAWRHFRRALRTEHRPAFDLLWQLAKRYTNAAATTVRPIPFENVIMAMLVGLAGEIQRLSGPVARPVAPEATSASFISTNGSSVVG